MGAASGLPAAPATSDGRKILPGLPACPQKPLKLFSNRFLRARMMSEQPQIYEFGRFRLDRAERSLRRAGEPVPLTPKVFGILLALVETSGGVVEKDELMRQVWPDSFVEEGNLTQNISVLRKALGETTDGKPYIETVARRGYRFVASVHHADEGQPMQAGANGEPPLRHAFAPPLAAESSMAEITLERAAGDNGAAMIAVAARSARLSPAVAATAPVDSSAATRRPTAAVWGRLLKHRVALIAVMILLAAATVAFYLFRT